MFGAVERAEVTLLVKTGRRNELTATFRGHVNEAETMISGTRQLTDDVGQKDGKLALRKH